MSCGVYKITNKVNQKVYIGQSINIEARWDGHIYSLKKGCHNHLYKAMRKYGVENFDFEILRLLPDLKYCMNENEKYFIKEYRSFEREYGYNKTTGGGSFEMSEETKKKMSLSKIGTRNGITAFLGHTHSEETKQKMRGVRGTRKTFSEETKLKMSESQIKRNEQIIPGSVIISGELYFF